MIKSQVAQGAALAVATPKAEVDALVAHHRAVIAANRARRLAAGPIITPSERLLRAIFGEAK
jgi:hypothetical protein